MERQPAGAQAMPGASHPPRSQSEDGSLPAITALVLAGGRGSRMGGLDKGLQSFGGTPLGLRALERLRQQSHPPLALAISANRNLTNYQAFGVPVWPDDKQTAWAGPLAGLLAGLDHCKTPLLLSVPCDVPCFPLSLCERLLQALLAQNASLAVAAAPQTSDSRTRLQSPLQRQPVFCLVHADLRDDLRHFLHRGGRRMDDWTARQRRVIVAFDQPGDDPLAFANANTLAELRALEDVNATQGFSHVR